MVSIVSVSMELIWALGDGRLSSGGGGGGSSSSSSSGSSSSSETSRVTSKSAFALMSACIRVDIGIYEIKI